MYFRACLALNLGPEIELQAHIKPCNLFIFLSPPTLRLDLFYCNEQASPNFIFFKKNGSAVFSLYDFTSS